MSRDALDPVQSYLLKRTLDGDAEAEAALRHHDKQRAVIRHAAAWVATTQGTLERLVETPASPVHPYDALLNLTAGSGTLTTLPSISAPSLHRVEAEWPYLDGRLVMLGWSSTNDARKANEIVVRWEVAIYRPRDGGHGLFEHLSDCETEAEFSKRMKSFLDVVRERFGNTPNREERA